MHRRFAISFFLQALTILVVTLAASVAFLVLLGIALSTGEADNDLLETDSFYFNKHVQIEEHSATIDAELKEKIRAQNGWLAIYNDKKQLLMTYNAASHETFEYNHLLSQEKYSMNVVYTDYFSEKKRNAYVVYGKENKVFTTMEKIKETIDLQSNQLPKLHTKLQVLYVNDNKILDSKNVRQSEDMVEKLLNGYYEYHMTRFVDEASGKTIIVAEKRSEVGGRAVLAELKWPLIWYGIGSIVFLGGMIYFFVRKFSSPIRMFMEWIRNIGEKRYDVPLNKKGKPLFLNRTGHVKFKYRIYREMIQTLQEVSDELHNHELERKKLEMHREEWIAGLSHDLKTPLATVMGYTKMLQTDYNWTEDEKAEFLMRIDEKSIYMKKLIDDLTLTYRIKNNNLPIQKQVIDVHEMIRRTIIQHLEEHPTYLYDIHISDDPLFIKGDPVLFQRVLDNLLLNSVKHNPVGTKIDVTTTHLKNTICIEIRDNGKGMDECTKEQLFNRYYRGTNTTEHSEGSGLGMAITQQLVHLHDGKIDVRSALGQGTIFKIYVPHVAEQDETM